MKSMLVLIHGNSLEEMKANLLEAFKEFEHLQGMENPNCLSDGFEFDSTDCKFLADVALQSFQHYLDIENNNPKYCFNCGSEREIKEASNGV